MLISYKSYQPPLNLQLKELLLHIEQRVDELELPAHGNGLTRGGSFLYDLLKYDTSDSDAFEIPESDEESSSGDDGPQPSNSASSVPIPGEHGEKSVNMEKRV